MVKISLIIDGHGSLSGKILRTIPKYQRNSYVHPEGSLGKHNARIARHNCFMIPPEFSIESPYIP